MEQSYYIEEITTDESFEVSYIRTEDDFTGNISVTVVNTYIEKDEDDRDDESQVPPETDDKDDESKLPPVSNGKDDQSPLPLVNDNKDTLVPPTLNDPKPPLKEEEDFIEEEFDSSDESIYEKLPTTGALHATILIGFVFIVLSLILRRKNKNSDK